MQHLKINRWFVQLFALVTLAFVSFSFTTNYGLDGYEISLNNKLIFKGYVNQPLNTRMLQLDKAKETDQLRITYTHCRKNNGPGDGRSISLRDDKGNTLKKWTFADANNSDVGMTIAVKELLQLEKAHSGNLRLTYNSSDLPKGEMLAMLNFK